MVKIDLNYGFTKVYWLENLNSDPAINLSHIHEF